MVREDPKRKGLLYAGTETGMYISFNDGRNWKPFQLNLPIVPITDLAVKDNNLIVATQGRSLWIIDDLTVLHQLNKIFQQGKPSSTSQKMPIGPKVGQAEALQKQKDENHPNGVITHFFLKDFSEKDRIALTSTIPLQEIRSPTLAPTPRKRMKS